MDVFFLLCLYIVLLFLLYHCCCYLCFSFLLWVNIDHCLWIICNFAFYIILWTFQFCLKILFAETSVKHPFNLHNTYINFLCLLFGFFKRKLNLTIMKLSIPIFKISPFISILRKRERKALEVILLRALSVPTGTKPHDIRNILRCHVLILFTLFRN